MSASLVGSEMCIRDSGSPGDAWPRPAVRGRGGRGGALVRWRLDEQAWDPVSYTHLTLPTICSV
eukprot:7812544-Alexandrium_andersonii.AAC.1